ncbi:uncharacterized protein LOC143855919 [Tasmannia lanceolata]|uniref:uncharacterized protein LOC143855919 n=1 Tax=Tasmannia lanceolata TaxID=3420 RepID=UPI004064686C
MAAIIRYVDKKGNVVERLLDIVHVTDTSALSLKATLEELFLKHGLSISRLRGQGYDGSSNMRGEFNGLKALILKENPYAFYIHCFAHQLQLALVTTAKHNGNIDYLFTLVTNVVNVVGVSCKHRDLLQEKQAIKVFNALENCELSSGRGQNQETNLKRLGDTRWGSHYYTLLSLISMFSSIIDVLDIVTKSSVRNYQREFYPVEFSPIQLLSLDNQLKTYIMDMKDSIEFSELKGISDLAKRMVETRRDIFRSDFLATSDDESLLLLRRELVHSLADPVLLRRFFRQGIRNLEEEFKDFFPFSQLIFFVV